MLYIKKLSKYFIFSFFSLSIIFAFTGSQLLLNDSNAQFNNKVPGISNLDYQINPTSITTNFEVEGLESGQSIGYESTITSKSMIKEEYWGTTIQTCHQLLDALGTRINLFGFQSLGNELDKFISPFFDINEIPNDALWQSLDQQIANPLGFECVTSLENEIIISPFNSNFRVLTLDRNLDDKKSFFYWISPLDPNLFQTWEFIVDNVGYVAIKSIGTDKYLQNYNKTSLLDDGQTPGLIVSEEISYFQIVIEEPSIYEYSDQTIFLDENISYSIEIQGLTLDQNYIVYNKFMDGFEGEFLYSFKTSNSPGTISDLTIENQSYDLIEFSFYYEEGINPTIVQYSIDNGTTWIGTNTPDQLGKYYVLISGLEDGENYTIYLRTFSDSQEIDRLEIEASTVLRTIGTITQAKVTNVTYNSIEFEYLFVYNGLSTTLQYSIDSGTSWINIRIFDAISISSFEIYTYTISNLNPQTQYTILLRTQSGASTTPPIIPEGGNDITTSFESSSSVIWIIIGSTLGGLLILGIGGFYWYKRSKILNSNEEISSN